MSHPFLGLLLIGCTSTDYGVARRAAPNPGTEAPVDLKVDVAFQEHGFGSNTSRCQVQVAFRPLPGPDGGGGAPGEAPGRVDSPPATQVARPDGPGMCAVSDVPVNARERASGGVDNWQVSGEVIGPERVFVASAVDRIALTAAASDQGGVRYELADCDAERFPFSRTLGLDVPRSDDPDGVHPFEMPELIAVGPRVVLDAPTLGPDGRLPVLPASEDLAVRWTLDGDDPVVDGVRAESSTLVQLLNQDVDRVEPDRWLVCQPAEEGWFDVPVEFLAELLDGREDPSKWRTQVNVHTEFAGAEQPTPWGRALRVRAHVSVGGGVTFATD
jgi:hypothetical protein